MIFLNIYHSEKKACFKALPSVADAVVRHDGKDGVESLAFRKAVGPLAMVPRRSGGLLLQSLPAFIFGPTTPTIKRMHNAARPL